SPSGIGGWLILPILGFAGTILLTGLNLLEAARHVDGLVVIFNATSGPIAALKVPTILSLLAGCLVILSAGYCLYLIFAKKHVIIKFATAHYVILMSGGFADVWTDAALQALPGQTSDPSATMEAVRGIVIALIWIPYFHRSKRVRNTFVNGRVS